MNRRTAIRRLATCFLTTASLAQAQQPTKIPRIGYLLTTSNPIIVGPYVETFRQALRDLGYIEGKNIPIEYRYIEGQQDEVPSLVAELIQLKVAVLLVSTLTSIRAAKQATATMLISTGALLSTWIKFSKALSQPTFPLSSR